MGADPTEALRKLRLSYLTLTQEAITNREEREERQRKADEGKGAYTDLLLKDSTDLYDEESGVELTDEAAAERVAAVTALQGKTRQKQAKDKVETLRRENKASTTIQTEFRRQSSVKVVAGKREEHSAAVKVQSKVRQNLAKQTVGEMKEMEQAALIMQTKMRQQLAMKDLENMKQEEKVAGAMSICLHPPLSSSHKTISHPPTHPTTKDEELVMVIEKLPQLHAPYEPHCVELAEDGNIVAAGFANGQIRVWDVNERTKDKMQILARPKNGSMLTLPYNTIAWKPIAYRENSRLLLAADCEGEIEEWILPNTDGGSFYHGTSIVEGKALDGQTSCTHCLDFFSDGRRFLAGTSDACIRMYDLETKQKLHECRGKEGFGSTRSLKGDVKFASAAHGQRVVSIRVDKSNPNMFVSGAWDNTVRVWDARCGKDRQPAAATTILTTHATAISSRLTFPTTP